MGQKLEKRVPLGELYKGQPNRVDDYYDDPVLPQKDKVITDIIRVQDVAELKAQGMNLYEGTNPSLINGSIKLSPFRFDYAKPSIDIAIGKILKDLSFEFSGQVVGKQALTVKYVGDFLENGTINSPFILGSGKNFTVCFRVSVSKKIDGQLALYDYAYLISGTIDGANLKNVKLAKVGLKGLIFNVNLPSVEGNIEIYSDSDGKTERQ